jgi:hypothetical protein
MRLGDKRRATLYFGGAGRILPRFSKHSGTGGAKRVSAPSVVGIKDGRAFIFTFFAVHNTFPFLFLNTCITILHKAM